MYFDLHFHPSFKSFVSGVTSEERDNCWEEYSNVAIRIKSKSSLPQIKRSNVSIGVATIYSMEKQMSSSFFFSYLTPGISMISKDFWINLPSRNNFNLLLEEIEHFEKYSNHESKYRIINSIRDYDPNQLNFILAIEGGHALESTPEFTVEQNLLKLKNFKYNFLYLTFTHMTKSFLCTHAFGMQQVKQNNDFKPHGSGISKLGFKIIDLAYSKSKGSRILIDVKHMSLVSRKQFYEYRKKKGYDSTPIIASHVGVTGISWEIGSIARYFRNNAIGNGDFIQVKYDRPEGSKINYEGREFKAKFNPWSINLYDEDILEIINSSGLIGINFDQRILGAQKVKGEYFSRKEFELLTQKTLPILEGEFELEELSDVEVDEITRDYSEMIYLNNSMELNQKLIDSTSAETTFEAMKIAYAEYRKKKHILHLANTIIHIIRIGGEKAWKNICIGSDFDGLINPINNCRTVEDYETLEVQLPRALAATLTSVNSEPNDVMLLETGLDEKVRDIMFNNAKRFLDNNYN